MCWHGNPNSSSQTASKPSASSSFPCHPSFSAICITPSSKPISHGGSWRAYFFLPPCKCCLISCRPPLIPSTLGRHHIHSQLSRWKAQLLSIHDVLSDTMEKQITSPSVKLWLSDLCNLAYDQDDILDWTTSTPKCCDAGWHCNLMPLPSPPQASYGVSSLLAVLVSSRVMLLLLLAWGPRSRISPAAWKIFPLAKPNCVWKRLQGQRLLGKDRPPHVCLMNHKFMADMMTKRRLLICCLAMILLVSPSLVWVGWVKPHLPDLFTMMMQ